jgi:hypothetical protein
MNPNHFLKKVRSGTDLAVEGEYFSLTIRNIVLAAYVRTEPRETAAATLFEVALANRQNYRMPSYFSGFLLIDSEAFQHKPLYKSDCVASVITSERLPPGTPLPSPADELEGRARTKGWLAFPQLENGIVPHRFIYKHNVFDPGETSGFVRGIETLELEFDLGVFARILNDENAP